jgi:hypothetical protein
MAACGTDTSNQWSDEEMQTLSQWLVKRPDGRIVLSPATPNQNFIPPVEEPSIVEEEEASSSQQLLVSGTVFHPQFQAGSFLIEARGTRNCPAGLCPEMAGLPFSSVFLNTPGYFSLVVPHNGQAIFVVATYKREDGATDQKEIYLGTIETRVDGLHLDFGASAALASNNNSSTP